MFAYTVDPERVLAGRSLEAVWAGVAARVQVTRVHVTVHVCRALGGVRACAAIPQVVHRVPERQLTHVHCNILTQQSQNIRNTFKVFDLFPYCYKESFQNAKVMGTIIIFLKSQGARSQFCEHGPC